MELADMKAVVHIGTAKTGTTSIQRFLNVNRQQLIDQGILYTRYLKAGTFGRAQPEYMRYALSKTRRLLKDQVAARHHRFHTLEELDRMVEGFDDWLAEQASTPGCDSFVISSEQIWVHLRPEATMRALHDLMLRHFDDVTYVLYIRRQDKWLASMYSETLRNAMSHSFEAFLTKRGAPDYHHDIRNLVDVLGRDRVEVRLFERDVMKGHDVVDDFCAVAGIDPTDLKRPERMNEALSLRASRVLRRLNGLATSVSKRGSDRHARMTRAARRFVYAYLNQGRGLSLTPAQRDQVLAQCADSNEQLRQWLFPDRETLFDMRDVATPPGKTPGGKTQAQNLQPLHAPGLPGAERKPN
ncbi:hypothetical protein RXV86_02010 [Alisedimentitalea sp. MJ-SS2]|uniref:hypothetical protein n=1 Tax=Aliisedimentitalea sp. MJ-SS2 TaxID=3049795 RepID=UPI0029091826|nr:hypothetical protein [Alisedimentitalea sp. MJ-SS2]MDU8926151.1 hypothetical protein [Alisedimentitalea sp. MJ-SS2]